MMDFEGKIKVMKILEYVAHEVQESPNDSVSDIINDALDKYRALGDGNSCWRMHSKLLKFFRT